MPAWPLNLNGEIVEIDEPLFIKCKANVGKVKQHIWVFGMIERKPNRKLMIPVPTRGAYIFY